MDLMTDLETYYVYKSMFNKPYTITGQMTKKNQYDNEIEDILKKEKNNFMNNRYKQHFPDASVKYHKHKYFSDKPKGYNSSKENSQRNFLETKTTLPFIDETEDIKIGVNEDFEK